MNFSIKGMAVLSALGLFPCIMMAEGYQVNTLSTRQLGMGHTGIAMKLGAESQFFNPAGMAFMDNKIDLSASFNAIMPTATARIDGKKYTTDCKASTPFSVFGAFDIFPYLKGGISVYTPYGSSIDWTDNWPGATLSQRVSLQTFTVQPTLAWKIIPGLSIGAGLNITWGSVDLHKGLIGGHELNAMLGTMGLGYPTPDITPVSAKLNGKSNIACGVNLGVMYDLTRSITLGVNYRSKMMMKVKAGQTEIEYGTSDPRIQAILGGAVGEISRTDFSAEMPLPATLGFGGSWHNNKVTADLEAQLTFWNAYKSLDISFAGAPQFDQHLPKNYHNSWLVRGGVEWKVTKRLDLRGGLMVDFTPVDKEFYNPETPGMTKIEPTLGLTFRPLPCLGINVAGMYVAGCGEKNASYEYTNILGQTQKFTADYSLHSWTGSIGVSLNF
ncbi:MAG: hypothetical protein HDS79_05745 [Bacteroidales bacterium]|nr:hypothetical protein [Bacteroidales bacterium]MDE7465684.1 outer membrane protein transport protein [Muribaculaceae bacterium]